MKRKRSVVALVVPILGLWSSGCSVSVVNLSSFKRPPRAPQLDAYDNFVGQWDWEAEVVGETEGASSWKGKAEWKWALDKRYLHGTMSAESDDAKFEAAGVWSWHPKRKKYVWSMFNNWGYPQHGTARYCKACCAGGGCWRMDYKGVGLDGTTSYGRYTMCEKDSDTLDWSMIEWADPLHIIKKTEMKGTYKRRK